MLLTLLFRAHDMLLRHITLPLLPPPDIFALRYGFIAIGILRAMPPCAAAKSLCLI